MLTFEQAADNQRAYRASEAILERLSDTTILAAVGATAVGKNFLMDKSGLPVVGTLTTRESRSSDDKTRYRYTTLPNMLKKIEKQEVIQYGAYSSQIYASELQDYVLDEPNISDIYSSAVSDLENKNFKNIRAFSTLTPKHQWMSQLMERFEGMQVGAIYSRLDEARQSLRWTRAQTLGANATNHLVIINTTTNVDENVSRIRDFAHGIHVESPDSDTVRHYAENMEQAIDIVQARLAIKGVSK